MKILTFDTSTDVMYVTIGKDSSVEAFKTIETTSKSYNSAHLIPTIIELLKSQGLMPENIDAIGINVGPGSFTGIRASATVAKVMSHQLNIPVVGVSSMQVYSRLNKTGKDSLILLDARRGKAYMAVYTAIGDVIVEPCAVDYENAIEYAKNNDLFVICDKKMSEIIQNSGLDCLNLSKVKENLGIFLAELTYKYLSKESVIARKPEGLTWQSKEIHTLISFAQNDNVFSWHNLKPLYIQPPPISMPKKI